MGPLWMMAYFEEGGLRSKPILLLTVDKNTEQPSEEEVETPDREKNALTNFVVLSQLILSFSQSKRFSGGKTRKLER